MSEHGATRAAAQQPPRRRGGGAAPAAAWAFAFVILRVFAVSGYDWNTAFAVSTTISLNDGLALLFGSLMAGYLLVAILLMVVLPLLVAAILWARGRRRPVVVLPASIGVVLLVALTGSFDVWWLPAAAAAILGVIALLRRLPEQSNVRRALTAVLARVGWVSGVAVLLAAAFIQTPWVPLEVIETTDGPMTGYVLSVDSGYLNVLTEDHQFLILNSADVVSRK